MDEARDFLKKNWMYVLGGVIGLYLVMRFMGGGSSSNAGTGYAAYAAQQNQLGLQYAQISAQTQAAQAQIAAQQDATNKQYELGKMQVQASAQNDFLKSQAMAAESVGKAASGVIGALYTPTIAGMQSAAYENAAALSAAANIAGAGYLAQAGMVSSTSQVTQAVAQGLNQWGGVAQGAGWILSGPTTLQSALGAGTQLGTETIRAGAMGNRGGSVTSGGLGSGGGGIWGNLFATGVSSVGGMFGGGAA